MMRALTFSAVALLAVACSNSTSPAASCTTGGTLACVSIQDFSFSPATLTIKVGTTVQWTNHGPSEHTTTSDAATPTWDSGQLTAPSGGGPYGGGSSGASYSFTFTTPGTYGYHCTNHPPSLYPNFTGTITVTQ